jgi:nicotinate-nucleotide adenylyltransferase
MPRQRLGLFGGTFDPPHLGHLILASEAAHQLGLDRILWVLAANPPHKDSKLLSSVEDRLAMLRLAIEGNPVFEISRLELDRPGPHFTIETLEQQRSQAPDSDFALLLGEDSLEDLPGWRRPRDILAACDVIGVMRRRREIWAPQGLEAELPGLDSKLRYIDAPLIEIASSDIRDRASRGLPFRYMLPPSVYDHVMRRHLYQS